MKNFNQVVLIISLLLAQSGLFAQDTETRSLGSFDGISVSQSIDAELIKGNSNEAKITVKNVDLDDVITEVENGILKLKMKKKWNNNWGGKKKKVQIVLTYADYPSYISASSSADVISRDKIITESLEVNASSSADIILDVDVKELESSVSASADIEISGSADEAYVKVSASADFLGKRLSTKRADLSASSSGDIELRVSDELSAKASSSGDITYYGNPDVKKSKKSSSGDISRG